MMRPTTTNDLFSYTPSVPIWMGDASTGRSATSPTFFRSTLVRTRMEWQYSHVVWTALDQRNLIGAPQFGQFPAGWLMRCRDDQSFECARTWRRMLSAGALRNPTGAAGGNKTGS